MAESTKNVSEEKALNWRGWLGIGIGAIFVSLGVVFVVGERQKMARREEISQAVSQVVIEMELGLERVRSEKWSREEAQVLVEGKRAALVELEDEARKMARPDLRTMIETEKKRLEKATAWLYGQEEIGEEEARSVYDLRMIDKNWLTARGEMVAGEMWLIDVEGRKIAAVNLQNKQYRLTELSGQTKFAARYGGDEGGINQLDYGMIIKYEIGMSEESAPRREILAGDDKAEIGVQADWFCANNTYYYFWTSNDNEIWRLQKTRFGAGAEEAINKNEVKAWLNPKEKIVIAEISDVLATNELWAGTKNGEVWRLQGGEKVAWEIKNLATKLEGEIKLATSEEGESIFILASEQERALVVDKKSGEVQRDLNLAALKRDWIEIVENEKAGKFYVIGTTEIFEFDIRAAAFQ